MRFISVFLHIHTCMYANDLRFMLGVEVDDGIFAADTCNIANEFIFNSLGL